MVRRIGVMTSGGDAPGMNAAIRSVVRTAFSAGVEVAGIEHGYEGLLTGKILPLASRDVGGVLDRGGTFLGTSRSKRFATPEGVAEGAAMLKRHGIGGLVVIGGDGSYRGAQALAEHGILTVGVPGTIDNDVAGTDTAIGFDTALNTIAEAVGKVRDTASSHERTFVIEVMGRESGLLATYAGLACGADGILVPEVEWDVAEVCAIMNSAAELGKRHCIIMMAEGAGDAIELARSVEGTCGDDVRAVVLGHIQRGGSPSAFDRILASRLAARAVSAIIEGESGVAVGLRYSGVVTYPLDEAFGVRHPFRGEIYDLARVLSQ